MDVDEVQLRKRIEGRVLEHAKSDSLQGLADSIVKVCLGVVNGNREAWYETGYSVGYHDRVAEVESDWASGSFPVRTTDG